MCECGGNAIPTIPAIFFLIRGKSKNYSIRNFLVFYVCLFVGFLFCWLFLRGFWVGFFFMLLFFVFVFCFGGGEGGVVGVFYEDILSWNWLRCN